MWPSRRRRTPSSLQQLLLACGLLALLIGGIGIVNTMLVSVGRRTKEIAVLKTLGLKGYQVVPLFLMEAVLLGIAGSILGMLAGIGLSVADDQPGRDWLGAQVSWALRPSPLLVGLALGVIATAVFGFLPVLARRAHPPDRRAARRRCAAAAHRLGAHRRRDRSC